VVFIPAGRPAHKPADALAPARDRLRMVRLLIAGHPELAVTDLELRRAGPSYTIDTVRALRRRYPRRPLFWIVGADAVREIPTWHRWRTLVRMIRFIVVSRPGYPLRRLPGYAARFLPLAIEGSSAAASRLRRRLGSRPAGTGRGAAPPSALRPGAAGPRAAGRGAALPPAVAAYIRRHRLYARSRAARA